MKSKPLAGQSSVESGTSTSSIEKRKKFSQMKAMTVIDEGGEGEEQKNDGGGGFSIKPI